MIRGGYRMKKARGKIKRQLLYCPHCGEIVTKSTYYRHKSKFCNRHSKTWVVVHDESVLLSASTNSSDSSQDYSVHYSDEYGINDDGDAGEELVQLTNRDEDHHSTCENTAATSLQSSESFDTGNEVSYGS